MPTYILVLLVSAFLLLVIGVLILLGFLGSLAGGRETTERLQIFAAIPDLQTSQRSGRRNTQLARLRLRLNNMLSMLGSDELNLQLMSANWPMTVSEFILIRVGAMLAGFLLGWILFGSLISGVALAVISNLVPAILLRRGMHRRRTQFERQLIDVLVLLNGAVLAGFSLLQAMGVVEREMKAPASEEFRRVQREVALGLPLSQALLNLAARMENDDLNMLVTAINIQSKVGGNLATMMEAVTETIRDRVRLFAEVRVITTQQRYSSYLISLLPFVIGALLFLINPDHIMRLFLDPSIRCVPIFALTGILLGHLVLKRLVKIEI